MEAIDALFVAVEAIAGFRLCVPEIGKDAASMERQSVCARSFHHFQTRRSEDALLGQDFHRTVAATRWNERCGGCSTIEGEVERPLCPVERFVRWHEGRLHQNEYAKVDSIAPQKMCGGGKLIESHALVQAVQNLGMSRFKAHGHFQLACQQVAE